ncbi:MAG TPA: XdhC family protein [Polyangiaceae bacterium]|jgi:xanthine/CO dehydrogenase XdhC/CoxF family maturation factor
MAELNEIRSAARSAAARGEPLWLATVMRVRGSAYRHAGARMLFSADRMLAGSVSGGCLEASIVHKGPWLTREGPACICFEGGRSEDDERPSGSGCDGTVDILVESVQRGAPGDALALIDECLANERRAVVVTVFEANHPRLTIGSRFWLGENGAIGATVSDRSLVAEFEPVLARALENPSDECRMVRGPGFEAMLEIIEPAPHLFVFGAGPDAVPVVTFAHALGLNVTVCDPSRRVSVRERFPQTDFHVGSATSLAARIARCRTPLALVMSHHFQTDVEALGMLLESRATYIGLLGPARRTARLLNELKLEREQLSPRDRARLHGPVGLDLGAQTPAQIALAILAEIQAILQCANAKPLSRRAPRAIQVPEPNITLASASELARTGST